MHRIPSMFLTACSVGALAAAISCTMTATPPEQNTTGGETPTAGGTPIYPGESIQARVDAFPSGTTFIIKAGRHVRQSVIPKDGDKFIGESGAVLDGEGTAIRAFTGSANDVVIKGLVIERYAPGSQRAAVYGGASVNWLVEENEFRYNDGGGLHIGRKMRVLRNNFHHNAQTGVSGHGDSVLVEGNEIAFNNNERAYDFNWEAGGAKLVRTRWLTLRNNEVHDNVGPGLWIDIDCWSTLIEGNRVQKNEAEGIFVEISYNTVVRNNTLIENGVGRNWVLGGGILVNSSPDTEVYGNTVAGNLNGIVGVDGNRGSGEYGPYVLQNLHVHDNTVNVSARGVTGIGIYGGSTADVFSSARNNRFVQNTYFLGANARPFAWIDGAITDAEWRSLGMDTAGRFNR